MMTDLIESSIEAINLLDDKRALQMARDAYTGSTSFFDANIRPQIERDLRQFQSRHAPNSKYNSDAYKTRSRIYRPKTRSVIRKNEAIAAEAFFSTADVVDVRAQDERDEVQQASAEIMKALLQYRLTKSIHWFQTCMGAYQDAQVMGTVVSYQAWEYDQRRGKDRPIIQLLPVENFRFDPNSNWTDPVNTSPYLIWLIPMYVKDVKAKMVATGKQQPWRKISDQDLKTGIRNYDTTRLTREENRTDGTEQVTGINDYSIVWVHKNIVDVDGMDMVYHTIGTDHLLSDPVPLDRVYATGQRPFVIGSCILEAHKLWPGGVPRITRDMQAEVNEIANLRIDNVKFVLNKRYFVARNRQVDIRSLTRNVPGSVTLMQDPRADVEILSTPDVTGSSYQEQDRLNMDFDDVAGNFSTSSVASNRKLNETVGGMELLSSDASQVSAYQLKTFVETWVEPVLRQLVALEQHYETDEIVLAIAGAQSEMFQRMGLDAVTDELLMQELTLSVSVGMGATSPTQKVNTLLTGVNGVKTALADGVLEKYGIDPSEVIKEVFGALGHKDGGKFFRSIGTEKDPRIASLEQQIQDLQQQLGAKHPPELLAAQVKLLEAQAKQTDANKVKVGVESAYAAMQAAEVIATVPAVAPVADKVMQNAGYTAPNPVGIDPNYPTPQAMSEAGMTALDTGADMQVAQQEADEGVIPDQNNTSPMFPDRTGALTGIETQAFDGAGNQVGVG